MSASEMCGWMIDNGRGRKIFAVSDADRRTPTIVIFITEIIIAPVKIFTEAAASVDSTVATALYDLAVMTVPDC